MRSYIRHPSDIPIENQTDAGAAGAGEEYLNNISQGGLAFSSARAPPVGVLITIRISRVERDFQVSGRVVWCQPSHPDFEIGVSFLRANDLYQVRTIEQICRIAQYKAEILAEEGRRLNGEQAAREWIQKFAGDFPALK
jgi:hypothetical protein